MSTDAIDNVQNSNDPKEDPNFKKFFANFGVTTGIIIGFVVLGSIGLYMSKIALSGILPTNPLFKPYTCLDNTDPVKSGDIEMNIVREFGLKGLGWMLGQSPISAYSQQATFDEKAFEKTFKGGYIKSLFDATQNPNPSNFSLWRSDVLNVMVSSSFSIIQTVFGSVGSLNESVAMFLFGLFGVACLPFLMLYNIGNSFWNHITSLLNVGSLTKGLEFLKLKTRAENGEKDFSPPPPLSFDGFFIGKKEPTDITVGEKIRFGLKWIFTVIGIACYFLVSMLLFSPVFVTFYTLFKPLLAKYRLKLNETYSGDSGSGKSESKGLFSFIRDTFAYKRSYIIFLSIINLFMQTNTYLGTYYFAAVIIAVIIAIVYCNIFVSKKSSNDNTMIPMKKDSNSGDNDNDELDSDDDGDDCVDEKDQLKLIQEQIDKIFKEDNTLTKKCINTNQRETIELINQVIQVCDQVQKQDPSNILTKVQLKDKEGFKELDEDVNSLVKLYFSGNDLGRQLLVLDASDEPEIQIRKLNAQLKYLRNYQKSLESAYDKCKASLTTFATASGITIPPVNSKISTPFLQLMTVVQEGEQTIYTIRPKILDIINGYIKQQEDIGNTNPNIDLNAGVSRNSLMSRIGLKKDKANLLYMERVMPLEQTIKQISTNLLPGKDILLDLILPDTDPQIDDWINKIQLEIEEYDTTIKAEPIFKGSTSVIKLSSMPGSKKGGLSFKSSSSPTSSSTSTSTSSTSSSPIAMGGLSPSPSPSLTSSPIAMGGLSPSPSPSPSLTSSPIDMGGISSSASPSSSSMIVPKSSIGGGKTNKTRRVQDSGKTEYKIRFV